LQNKVPSPQMWVVVKKMANVLTLVVTQCVLNQLERYWLLFDAIVATTTICYMMENKNNITNELM